MTGDRDNRRIGLRVRAIYAKELVEILRDRRTLIAMIVVPIALYPLLIIGSVHLLSIQDGAREHENITIAVQSAADLPEPLQPVELVRRDLYQAISIYRENRDGEGEQTVKQRVDSIERMELVPVDDVERAVAEGRCHVGLLLERGSEGTPEFPQHQVKVLYDKAEMRSESALYRVTDAFQTISKARRDQFLAASGMPLSVIEPIRLDAVNVAPPRKVGGMILGSIVPLVLVLMTITGAIYPAIDLTAGERERGTLETLIVCPVSAMEVITGKYLVVTTIAMLGAALNLASMGATLYFGGFTDLLGTSGDTELPLGVLPVILLALIPFALLFSAIMVAVCSYARTFKEAQNYIMPVILAALIPGGVAALPGTELHGVNSVIPVMNMVLMARELLLGHYQWSLITLVMLSTSLYAAAAVIVASRVFSTESVVFADSISLRSIFSRRLMRPSHHPSLPLVLILASVLFPVWMFLQFAIQKGKAQPDLEIFTATAKLMPMLLVGLPAFVLLYFKVALRRTFAVRRPRPRFVVAALLIGSAAWIPAHELFVLQNAVIPVPDSILKSNEHISDAFARHSIWLAMFLIAIVPAACEEAFFRGFLLSGLSATARKWTAILVSACVFALFHIILVKFVITAAMGVVLGYLCWQGRSIWPSVLAHMLHNASAVLIVFWPEYTRILGVSGRKELDHLPWYLIALGSTIVVVGLLLCRTPRFGNESGGWAPAGVAPPPPPYAESREAEAASSAVATPDR